MKSLAMVRHGAAAAAIHVGPHGRPLGADYDNGIENADCRTRRNLKVDRKDQDATPTVHAQSQVRFARAFAGCGGTVAIATVLLAFRSARTRATAAMAKNPSMNTPPSADST